MKDKTYGFKVSEEIYEKAKLIIDSSGMNSKDWFEKVLALYEVQSLQQTAPEYARDLAEIEIHTTRIYDLVVGMVQQSIYFKDEAIRKITLQLETKEQLLNELQEKINQQKLTIQTLTEHKTEFDKQQMTMLQQLEENRLTVENSRLLIAEYKEKNDTLTGLVAQYRGYSEENERLKERFAEEKAQLIEETGADKQALETKWLNSQAELALASEKINSLEKTLNEKEEKYKSSLKLTVERQEVARDKAINLLEREHQEKIKTINEEYNNRILELQLTTERIRESYEVQMNELKAEYMRHRELLEKRIAELLKSSPESDE